jgi:phage terminase large subunit-like protein
VDIIRNVTRADRNIAWIEKLKISDNGTIKPFLLADFQKQFVRDIYEPADAATPDKKLVNRGVLSVGRKNGKSELGGALVLLHLIGPESILQGSIVSGATTREQARIVFEAAARFIQFAPALQRHLKVVDSRSVIFVKTAGLRASGSKYKAIAAKPGAAHGLNPSFLLMDELAQAGNRKFFDALISSQGARADPFMLIISTVNEDPGHVLSTIIDDGLRTNEDGSPVDPRVVVHLHAAAAGCDLMDEAEWKRANPGLGLWIDRDRFAAKAEEARRNPAEEATFRLYNLNQQVASEAPLVSRVQWEACGPTALTAPAIRTQTTQGFDKGERLWGGLDLSYRVDLTAMAMVSDERMLAKAWFWKPRSDIDAAIYRDQQRYDLFADQGWLIPSDDDSIDPALVVAQIAALQIAGYDIAGIAYDRWKIAELQRVMDAHEVSAPMVPCGQGFVGLDGPVTALEAAILNKRLQHDGNPLLTWNMANAKVKFDAEGKLRKLTKLTPRLRIDGAIALAMALGLRASANPEQAYVSPFEDPDYKIPTF